MAKEVVLLGAVRTPVGKFGGGLSTTPAVQLGVVAAKEAMKRAGIKPEDIDANYHDGILEVKFPKTELPSPEEPKKIEIK